MFKKKTVLSLAVVLAFVLGASLAWAADFSADMKMSMGERVQTSKIWVSGNKMRTEVQAPNGKMIVIVDAKTGKILFLMPDQKLYMDSSGMAEAMGMDDMPKIGEIPKGAKKVGSEKLKGYRCDVYELDKAGVGKVKFWWVDSLGMPVKSESQTPMGKGVQELENIKEASQPASLFEVPAGYTKMNMPEMPKAPKSGK